MSTESTPIIAVAEGAFAIISELRERFADRAELRVGPVSTMAELVELTTGASALVVTLQPLRAESIAALPESVRVIVRAGVGLDTIDVEAARARGIHVVFQPMYATNEVADHAASLALAAWRRLSQADQGMRAEGWVSAAQVGPVHALHESTLGVIGTGRIGQALIRRLAPFVERVVVYDAFRDDRLDGVVWADSADEVFAQAQLLSLHVPLTPETHHLVNAEAIERMPDGAVIVNVSRGGLIDEHALAAALEHGKLSAAGIDVFEAEPLEADSPLRTAPNLLLSPHIAWYSIESGVRLASWSVADAIAFTSDGRVEHGAFAWS